MGRRARWQAGTGTAWWSAAGVAAFGVIAVAARDPGEPLREPVGEVTTPTKHGFRVRMTRMGLHQPAQSCLGLTAPVS